MIEEKGREDWGVKRWRSGRVNPRAISSDLSIPLFRASVGLNCSIKVFGYQILTLI